MFGFIRSKLQKIFVAITSKLGSFFSRKIIDDAALKELEVVLLSSDVGVVTAQSIIAQLKKDVDAGLHDGAHLKERMHTILLNILTLLRSSSVKTSEDLQQGYEGQEKSAPHVCGAQPHPYFLEGGTHIPQ